MDRIEIKKEKLHEIKLINWVWAVVTTSAHPVGGGLEVAYKTTREYAEQFMNKLTEEEEEEEEEEEIPSRPWDIYDKADRDYDEQKTREHEEEN